MILANSLASNRTLELRLEPVGVKEEETYPRVLEDTSGQKVATYSSPWLTSKDARSEAKRIPKARADFFILHVGIVESLPRAYPIPVRKMVNRFPIVPIRRRMNDLESRLITITNRRSSWISADDYGRYVGEIIETAKARLAGPRIILVNTFHVGSFIETKRPGTNDNVSHLNQVLRDDARRFGAVYLDAESVFDDRMFIFDRVHLNADGHRRLAALLRDEVLSQRDAA